MRRPSYVRISSSSLSNWRRRHSNDRDALRLEDGIEGMALPVAKNGAGGTLLGVGAADSPPALLAFISLQVLSCN
jgi:hypothetical protein